MEKKKTQEVREEGSGLRYIGTTESVFAYRNVHMPGGTATTRFEFYYNPTTGDIDVCHGGCNGTLFSGKELKNGEVDLAPPSGYPSAETFVKEFKILRDAFLEKSTQRGNKRRYAMVNVLEDACHVELLFASESDAQNFLKFVHTYIAESGAGNGYGAYWHFFDDPVRFVYSKTGTSELQKRLIDAMGVGICRARIAGDPSLGPGNIHGKFFETIDGAIVFNFDPRWLPPRLVPEEGDLARIVDFPEYDRMIGRVKAKNEKTVVLGPCWLGLEKDIELPLENVMKIYDFLSK